MYKQGQIIYRNSHYMFFFKLPAYGCEDHNYVHTDGHSCSLTIGTAAIITKKIVTLTYL